MSPHRNRGRAASRATCALAAGVVALMLAHSAAAQPPADEHAAHHPPAAAATVDPAPAAAPSGAMAGMSAMADGCTGEGCGGRAGKPLMAQVLALDARDAAARQALADESHRRMSQGAALLAQGAKEAQWAASMRDADTLARAQQSLTEGQALFDSGAAAHRALSQPAAAPATALSWFRARLGLPEPGHDATSFWLSATPAHLVLMTLLTLVAASLLGLQVLRRERVRRILGALPAGAGASAAPASAPAPTVAPAAPATPSPGAGLATPTAAAPAGAARRWAGELKVAQVVRETPTVSTFRLVDPAGGLLPFTYAPGQFLQVEVEPAPGAVAKRSYTIASSPTRSAYVELTVKREAQGVVSAHLHDVTRPGDLLKVAGPFGVFTFNGVDAESIVLIAGGVGVTPMMSVLRYLTDLVWPGDIFFIYSAKSPEEVVFREELEQLERRHPNLRTLIMVDARPAGASWLGPEGRLTRDLLQNEVPDIGQRRIHLCGPPGMMAAVKAILADLGVPDAQIRTEAFGPASLPAQPPAPEEIVAPPPRAPGPAEPLEVAPATVTFSVSGVAAALPQGRTVLEAAEGAGVEIPYSCRAGVCGVCVVKLAQGEVSMDVEDGLDPADKAQGYVLACQARSKGGDLVVEA